MDICMFVDTSVSTSDFETDYKAAINNIISDQKIRNPDASFSLISFNHEMEVIYVRHPIRLVKPFVFVPSGLTALYDTLCVGLMRMLKFAKETQAGPSIVIVITDGEDSCSKRNAHMAMAAIQQAKLQGWKFVFLGVDWMSVRNGKNLGFDTCLIYNKSEESCARIHLAIREIIARNFPTNIIDLTSCMESMKL